jgi:hypothetical protein
MEEDEMVILDVELSFCGWESKAIFNIYPFCSSY